MRNGAEVRGRGGSLLALLVVVLAVACGGDSTPDTGDAGEPDDVATLSPAPTDQPDEEAPVPADDERQAFPIADAAERAGVDPAEVTVVVDEDVTWPDGSLGCPQPGQFYTQALVEGYRVVVEAAGEEHHYHGRGGQSPAYCANPSPPVGGGTNGVVDR